MEMGGNDHYFLDKTWGQGGFYQEICNAGP